MSTDPKLLDILGWRLITVHIYYHMPDNPMLLQFFLWQEMDKTPDFPRLNKFLRFWQDNIEGPIHSVVVAVADILEPTDLTFVSGEYRLT